MSKDIIVAAGLAGILALGTCGCSASSSSSSSSTLETSVTDEEGTTTTTKTTTDSDGNTTTETSTRLEMGEWVDAWMGTSDKGYDVFYAQAPDGTQAFLVLHNEDADDTEVFIGETEFPEEDLVTVYGQESKFTFQIREADEEHDDVTLWCGDDYGTVEIERCDLDDLAEAVHEFDPDGVILSVDD